MTAWSRERKPAGPAVLGLVAELRETNRLTRELLRIRRPRSRNLNIAFPGLRPEAFKCRRKRVKSSLELAGSTRVGYPSPTPRGARASLARDLS